MSTYSVFTAVIACNLVTRNLYLCVLSTTLALAVYILRTCNFSLKTKQDCKQFLDVRTLTFIVLKICLSANIDTTPLYYLLHSSVTFLYTYRIMNNSLVTVQKTLELIPIYRNNRL